MEPQHEPDDTTKWRSERVKAEQRTAGEANTAKGQDVQKAVHRLRSRRLPEPGGGGTGDTEGGWPVIEYKWKPADTQAILGHEEVIH